jgi:hypothetical protein
VIPGSEFLGFLEKPFENPSASGAGGAGEEYNDFMLSFRGHHMCDVSRHVKSKTTTNKKQQL